MLLLMQPTGPVLMRADLGPCGGRAQVSLAFHNLIDAASELSFIWTVRGPPEGKHPGRDLPAMLLTIVL